MGSWWMNDEEEGWEGGDDQRTEPRTGCFGDRRRWKASGPGRDRVVPGRSVPLSAGGSGRGGEVDPSPEVPGDALELQFEPVAEESEVTPAAVAEAAFPVAEDALDPAAHAAEEAV